MTQLAAEKEKKVWEDPSMKEIEEVDNSLREFLFKGLVHEAHGT
jgi:hypothetical protein